MIFAIGQAAEIKKKQSDPIAFILGDDTPMSIGGKVSHLPTKLISAIDGKAYICHAGDSRAYLL